MDARVIPLFMLVALLVSCSNENSSTTSEVLHDDSTKAVMPWSVAIHGGAGDFSNTVYSPEEQAAYLAALNNALDSATHWLELGVKAVEVAVRTVVILEDCPLFNAGKGAVFNAEGFHEMDASVMDGANLKAGAIANLRNIKNPILAAQKVMTHSEHVLMAGEGARQFAVNCGLEQANDDYFFTDKAHDSFLKAKLQTDIEKHGTVGCVVKDKQGNLAAATSTGGMTMKRHGRIGDTPIIGAGTYANSKTCAVSSTGHGEYFIRLGVAKEISALIAHKGMTLHAAAIEVVQKELTSLGGSGGIIAVDALGNISMEFNTKGMFRGYAKSDGDRTALMFKLE